LKNSAPTGRIFFMKLDIFRKSVEKICFIKIWQEERVLYIKTFLHLWQYLNSL
jgi:hypothetical protein